MTTAQFLKSAVLPSDYPPGDRPEVAFVGRSNAGKSTLLNAMCGGSKVAKVSATPGKTRLLNFFDVGAHYRLVDLPGFGYAARDAKERKLWAEMINTFFATRSTLRGLLIICDMRREWTDDEQALLEMAKKKELFCCAVLTKIDKLSRGESLNLHKNWLKSSGLPSDFFWPVSAIKNDGVRELEDMVFKDWIK